METRLKYELVQEDPTRTTQAKVSRLSDKITGKTINFPTSMFVVRGREDIQFINGLFSVPVPQHFAGIQIDMHNLRRVHPQIKGVLPHNALLISDICSEVFYYGGLNPRKTDFYDTYNLIPARVKQAVKFIHTIRGCGQKTKAHLEAWKTILDNKKDMLELISNSINSQMAFGVDIPVAMTPLILNVEHLSLVESIYETATRLYGGELVNIEEEQGKIHGLNINIHRSFLEDTQNIKELGRTFSRVSPKAILFKLSDVDDIRGERKLFDGWKLLVKLIGHLSVEKNIPSFYMSTSTEGYLSQAFGIDCFSECSSGNVLERRFAADAETMRKMWDKNPLLQSGRIYLYHRKDFVTRQQFEQLLERQGTPYPMEELRGITADAVRTMSPISFRRFAKYVLVQCRNQEIRELTQSIGKGETRSVSNKFKNWLGAHQLFPS